MAAIIILSFLGLALSLYAHGVEERKKRQPGYKPFCDLTEKVSCTKALMSEWGKMLGISNALTGIAYYALIFSLALLSSWVWIYFLSIIALVFSLFLAYLLYSRVKSYCVLCTSIYLINLLIFLVVWTRV